MYCRNCGKEIQATDKFCPACGVTQAAEKRACPGCGSQIDETARVCKTCGTRLNPAPAAVTGVNYGTAPLPGVISSYKHGWAVLWPNFALILLAFIINYAISGSAEIFLLLGLVFVSLPLQFGYAYVYLKAVRKEKIEVEDVFRGFQTYWNSVGAGVLMILIILGGLILLIVPGIVFACKLAFVPYLVVDRKMGATAAIRESWRMTHGHAVEVFVIALLGILIIIAGLICLIVGVIISEMWIESAVASLYYAVSPQQKNDGIVYSVP